MEQTIQYEERIVLYMDLLGFKNLIFDRLNSTNGELSIYNILEYTSSQFKDYPNLFESVVITQFSDSLVVSFKYGEKAISLSLLRNIQHLLKDLILKYDVICRGGMTIGQLYHTDTFLFGPAMIEAYKLESTQAKYPRIIFSEKLVSYLTDNPDDIFENYPEVNESYVRSYIRRDSDYYYYINYFTYSSTEETNQNEKEYINKLYKLIKRNISQNNSENTRAKYLWMAEKYNEMIIGLKNRKPTDLSGFSFGFDASNDEWSQSLKII